MSAVGGNPRGGGSMAPPVHRVVAPAGLGWPAGWAFTARLAESFGTQRQRATVSLTPAAAFDAVSTARTAPDATYYVDVTATNGDSTGDGSSGNPYRSIWKAIGVGNAAGGVTSYKVIVRATGSYGRFFNPSYNNGGAILSPTKDCAILASGGRVVTGVFETTITASRDGTQVNTFTVSVTAATVDRILDRTRLDRFGNAIELTNVATAALCNAIPDSWAHVAGTVYINRRDQLTPTATNTRILRTGTQGFYFTSLVNVYVGGETANDGWECIGGALGGSVYCSIAANGSGKVMAMENVVATHGGGVVSTSGRAFSIDNFSGLVYLSNCRGDAGWTDGLNFHNANGGPMYVLTVNCEANDNGRAGAVSCNAWTTHETVVGIDLAGHYRESHGGACRSINTSKSWLAGTFVEDDRGDLHNAGSVPPTAFRVDDTAVYWLERTRIGLPLGGYGHVASGGGSAIHKRNVAASPHADNAVGTIDPY